MNKQTPWSLLAFIVMLALLPTFAWATYPAEVARTGQTKCYDAWGTEIACAGTGQDGDWLAGAPYPDPRFTVNGEEVTDGLTGLVWAKNANLLGTVDADNDTDDTAGDGAVKWQHALVYVAKLNNENYLNHNDWRLPNINELESLVSAQQFSPALPLNHPFTNVQSYFYWSSTSDAGSTDDAWIVHMNIGCVYGAVKSYGYGYVWPVRSGQCGSLGNSVICSPKTGQTLCYDTGGASISCSGTGQDGDVQAGVAWPSPRFVDNGDGTVSDSLTGLEWTKNANLAGGTTTWQGALDYVKILNTGGYSDWRLPNERELRSLADYSKYNPALPQGHPFTNVQSNDYWSSTSCVHDKYHALVVLMANGGVYYFTNVNKSDNCYVWPVRAGQCGALGNSTTTTTAAGSTTTSVISSTTTTAPGSQCPAKKVLGADNPKLDNLLYFRDRGLGQSAVGRKFIQIYYNNADSMNAALDRSPALRAVARRMLEAIAPIVGR